MSTQRNLFTGMGWLVVLFCSFSPLISSSAFAQSKVWVNIGLKDRIVLSVSSVVSDNTSFVYAGTDNGLYRRQDGDASWNWLDFGYGSNSHVYTMVESYYTLLVGTEDGFLRFDEVNELWEQLLSSQAVFSILEYAPGLGGYYVYLLGTANGVQGYGYHDDVGCKGELNCYGVDPWGNPGNKRLQSIFALARTGGQFPTYYMVAEDGAWRVWCSLVSRMCEYQQDCWTKAEVTTPNVYCLSIWDQGQSIIWGTDDGIKGSLQALRGVPISCIVREGASFPDNKTVYASSGNPSPCYRNYESYTREVKNPRGVWRATNVGQDWENISDGLPDLNVITLAVSPDKTIFAGTEKGIYKMVDAISTNTLVSSAYTEHNHQNPSDVIGDGAGNAIIIWRDENQGGGIRAQCVNAIGEKQWGENELNICPLKYSPLFPRLASDGDGGAIIAWADLRNNVSPGNNNDICAQRVNANGSTLWQAEGKPVCTRAENDQDVSIASDGIGGAILVWDSGRRIRAQRVDADGNMLWDNNGIRVVDTELPQFTPQILNDGGGNFIIVWQGRRNLASSDIDIYAQCLDTNHSRILGNVGKRISSEAPGAQAWYPQLISDGSGGAIILWSMNDKLYAQHITSTGDLKWAANGVAVHTDFIATGSVRLASDGTGGAIIAWSDKRAGGEESDIYAQRLNSNGTRMWGENGTPICSASGNQGGCEIIAAGAGGAIISWVDQMTGYGYGEGIYAQYVNSNGQKLWSEADKKITDHPGFRLPAILAHGGVGGVYLVWEDSPSAGGYGVCMQWLSYGSTAPIGVSVEEKDSKNSTTPRQYTLLQNYPNPFNPETEIRFELPQACHVVLKIYDILGKEVQTLADKPYEAGYHLALWNGRDKNQAAVSSGIYFYRLKAQTANGRKFVDTKKMSLLR